jgi:ceramide glucosyltransferase
LNDQVARFVLLGIAATPFIYYALALFSSWRFFRADDSDKDAGTPYTPPVSILKPVRGLDPEAYENFASFCRQDYPEYEILFCLSDRSDPVMPVIEKLAADFPASNIRVLFGSGRVATNDKVAKLARMTREAQHEILVINDSDVRVEPGYLRRVVAPLADQQVGAVTCFYVPAEETSTLQQLQSVGMVSDFYPGILVAWLLDGVKFALGPTMVTRRANIAEFGGFESIENRPGDDLLLGKLIAEKRHQVRLLHYWIHTVPDFGSLRDLVLKRLRWMTVMRQMRPWGHLGLIFTLGLPWSVIGLALAPSLALGLSFLAVYLGLRLAMGWLVCRWGLRQKFRPAYAVLIPLWDALATFIWLASFTRNTIRWRGHDYYLRNGELVPVTPAAEAVGKSTVPGRADV